MLWSRCFVTCGARSIQPKLQPVRQGKVVHLKRWTRFFETFPVGPNLSTKVWTEISGNFGWRYRARGVTENPPSGDGYFLIRLLGMCRWMGLHFHDWIDYNGRRIFNGVEWGRTFSDFMGQDGNSYLRIANVPERLYCRWKVKCSSFNVKNGSRTYLKD